MKMFSKKKNLLLIFVVVFSCFMMLPKVSAASYDVYTVKYKCNVRTSPSDQSSVIKNGNDDVKVYAGQDLEYLKTEFGEEPKTKSRD